jgi:hypothetical protein
MILHVITLFQEGKSYPMDVVGSLGNIRSLIEGDMPHADQVRIVLRESQNDIELAWFGMYEKDAYAETTRVLGELETFVRNIDIDPD